jgi:hypothetical protein
MPLVEHSVVVNVDIVTAFAVSQTTGDLRKSWDPFISSQRLLDGATVPAAKVRTETRSRHGLRMISEYTSFRAPRQVGMHMVEGPWFFSKFGGGWSFIEMLPGQTKVVWRYTFTVHPKWLRPIGHRVGMVVLGRDIRRRIDAFAAACLNPEIANAAHKFEEEK